MPNYLAFDPHPRAPAPLPPALSCDSQFHVFGPRDQYPVRPNAAYEMPTATWKVAKALHATLGIDRGVIVQATTYGADHTVVLDALEGLNAGGPRRYMACANAAVLSERDDAYLQKLHDAGVRGARFTRGGLGISLTPAEQMRAFARVKELGWYVKVQPEPNGIVEQLSTFESLDVPVLFDHMGRADPSLGDEDPSLVRILELFQRGNFWVMLSLSEKLSKAGAPWDDVVPLAQRLIDAAPDRCVWGSDWPHPISLKQPPNEGELLELFYRFAPDPVTRHQILVVNPARFFGFETP
jgi:predicted TIM-barrel fold metal-dependent hydrolase